MNKAILLPMLVLAGWTMIVWIWMYATRIPAMGRAGIDGTKMVGATGKSLRDDLVAAGEHRASWVADNYNHLMEQPTIFYPVGIIAALLPGSGSTDLALAWTYVALRVVHSVFQATINRIEVRFVLFFLSSLVLLALVTRTGMALLGP